MPRNVPEQAIKAMLSREEALFTQRNPTSKKLSEDAAGNWLKGVPMHWMVDWGTPFPLFIAKAQGVDVTDADGHSYVDFCLGDTGAMFGHSPPAVVEALQREGANGFTTMMPSPDAAIVGKLLEDRFGQPAYDSSQPLWVVDERGKAEDLLARLKAVDAKQAQELEKLLSSRGR